MGIIYRGWHRTLDQPIAIKVVRPEYAYRPEAVARFLNEVRTIARLRGPHVAHVLDADRMEDGSPYMILEYLEGADLRTLLDEHGPPPVARAVKFVLQACEAVAQAHALGIVHRDLKPENLFLTRLPDGSETIKVIDFGIAQCVEVDPVSRNLIPSSLGPACGVERPSFGSPHYMAPEQMTSPDTVDARADVWSLGIVLYELLTNQVPFEGATLAIACARAVSETAVKPSSLRLDVPPGLDEVVGRCLSKSPDGRYASAKDLFRALEPFAVDETQAVRREASGRIRSDATSSSSVRAAPPVCATMRSSQNSGVRLRLASDQTLISTLVVGGAIVPDLDLEPALPFRSPSNRSRWPWPWVWVALAAGAAGAALGDPSSATTLHAAQALVLEAREIGLSKLLRWSGLPPGESIDSVRSPPDATTP